MPVLIGLPYSPWTERARFALDARRVPYDFVLYTPVLGEPRLRLELKRWTKRVTVPVLVDERSVLTDSTDIARWADDRGEGQPLFPARHTDAIRELLALSDRAMAAGRAITLDRMRRDPDALAEMIPRAIRKRLGRMAIHVGGLAIRRTQQKYATSERELADHRRALEDALNEARAKIPSAPQLTIFEHLTYADIALAQAVVWIAPPSSGIRLGKASTRAFSDEALAERFADVVAWRDALYAAHRTP